MPIPSNLNTGDGWRKQKGGETLEHNENQSMQIPLTGEMGELYHTSSVLYGVYLLIPTIIVFDICLKKYGVFLLKVRN